MSLDPPLGWVLLLPVAGPHSGHARIEMLALGENMPAELKREPTLRPLRKK
jgi:hypothetical protein